VEKATTEPSDDARFILLRNLYRCSIDTELALNESNQPPTLTQVPKIYDSIIRSGSIFKHPVRGVTVKLK
jgi:hypothetical protein